MPVNRQWKIVGAAALALGALTGTALASERIAIEDPSDPIELASSADLADLDLSPESADSPGESPFDSPESPADSPDDPGWVDGSPESADSPFESPLDSPVSPASPAWVPPAPAPAPAPVWDSPASPASAASAASVASADSPD
jgi:hypothetical protein